MNLAFDAMVFARHVHRAQKRKYTGAPYSEHLAEVAGIVACVSFDPSHIAVAWLHDTMEDQGITFGDLVKHFGLRIAQSVKVLSDLEQGNRCERKAASRARLAAAPGWIQTIKCADLISNTSSIVQHDPKFAVVYLEEKRLLLDVMTQADPRLLKMARDQIGVSA